MLASIIAPVVLFLNWAGLAIGAIWLLALGEWKAAGIALLLALLGCRLINWITMIVSLPFLPLGVLAERRRSLGLLLSSVIATQWIRYSIVSMWMVGSFYWFLHSTKPAALIPAAVMGFVVATVPWDVDPNNEHTIIAQVPINALALGLMIAFAGLNVPALPALSWCIGIFNVFSLVHYRIVVDSMVGLPTSRELRWYESVWAYSLSTFLLLTGSYPAGLIAVAGGYANDRLFNSTIPGYLKYTAAGAVSVICFVCYIGALVMFRLLERH